MKMTINHTGKNSEQVIKEFVLKAFKQFGFNLKSSDITDIDADLEKEVFVETTTGNYIIRIYDLQGDKKKVYFDYWVYFEVPEELQID